MKTPWLFTFLYLVLPIVFFLICPTASAVSIHSIEWQNSPGGSFFDKANDIIPTTDGGFLVVGWSDSIDGDVTNNHGDDDYWVVKLDSHLGLTKQNSIGGSNIDQANSISKTADGGYIVAGESIGYVYPNFWVVKLDSNLNRGMEGTYGGFYEDVATSVKQTADGGYIIAGRSKSSDSWVPDNRGGWDYYVVKTTDQLIPLWKKSLGGSRDDLASDILETADGSYIVVGQSESNDIDVTDNKGDYDFWIVKLDGNLNIIWRKSFGGPGDDRAFSIQKTMDGGYIIVGQSDSKDGDVTKNQGSTDYWVLKLDGNLNKVWQRSFGGSGSDAATSVQQTVDGGYIVAGNSDSTDGDVTGNHGDYDYWLVKLDGNGNLEWQKSLGGSGWDSATGVLQTADTGYVIAGSTRSSDNDGDVNHNHGGWDYWVVKLSATSFTATETRVIPPLTVQFEDTSTNNPTSWSWDFGDNSACVWYTPPCGAFSWKVVCNNPGSNSNQHPSHLYQNAGDYTVSLTATNAGGSNMATGTVTVNRIYLRCPKCSGYPWFPCWM